LHLKKGDKAKALATYTEVAEMFSRTGFDAKAVAIYKQILRVEEDALDARTRLGECFQRMGLTSDALREFQDAFKICQKRELKREAFELLRRVASLDPSNIADRLNLAGLFVREGMLDDAKREFTALLEEVRRQTSADLVVRVAEQMLHAFPDSHEALGALAWAKLSVGAYTEAVKLLKPAVAKFPDDIQLRESLVSAYEAAGDDAAAKRVWREIAELYKRRGDLEKSRDILQRHATVEAFNTGDENTTPSLLLTDSTGRAPPDGDVIDVELDEPAAPARPVARPSPPASAPRVATLVEKGRATQPPDRAPRPQPKPAAAPPAVPAVQTAADLIAEARVSLEFGDRQEALRIARSVLELEPESAAARELLVQAGGAPEVDDGEDLSGLIEINSLEESGELTAETVPPPMLEVSHTRPELAALSSGEEFDTLPDIEIVLEDEEDRDEHYASVEPPLELALEQTPFAKKPQPTRLQPAKPQPARPIAAPAPPPPSADDSLDIDIDIDLVGESEREAALEFSKPIAVELEFAKPLASERGDSGADVSAQVAESLSEADFYLEQDLIDEAARIYESVLELAPQHPKAMLRLGEIEARRGRAPAVEADIASPALGDTMVCEPGRRDPLGLEETPSLAESIDLELSVVGEDTIPPLEELEPALPDEIVFAEDTAAPLELELEPEVDENTELDETNESVDEEGEFDLAAMLDEDDPHTSNTIGTLIGVGSVGRGFAEVFSAFKKGIEEQVAEGDSDTHYDLAIAYKEMGLHEDAVRELEAVMRTGARTSEALSLLANCKLSLGDPTAAAAHLEDALARAGDSDPAAVSLRYDLGEALLAAGRDAEAREAFKKVAAADPKFRDVAERISRFG